MTIVIGNRALATERPIDLDARLIASTGCTALEHVAILERGGTANQIARALHPMLSGEDVPTIPDLAELVATDDAVAVRRETVALLLCTRTEG